MARSNAEQRLHHDELVAASASAPESMGDQSVPQRKHASCTCNRSGHSVAMPMLSLRSSEMHVPRCSGASSGCIRSCTAITLLLSALPQISSLRSCSSSKSEFESPACSYASTASKSKPKSSCAFWGLPPPRLFLRASSRLRCRSAAPSALRRRRACSICERTSW